MLGIFTVMRKREDRCSNVWRPNRDRGILAFFWGILTNERNDPRRLAISCNSECGRLPFPLFIFPFLYLPGSLTSELRLGFRYLSQEENRKLSGSIRDVRNSFGDRHGIWIVIQDSTGSLMINESQSIINYRAFCEMIIDPLQWPWFYQPMEFYKQIEDKRNHQLQNIIGSLNRLADLLEDFKHPYIEIKQDLT